MSSPGSLILNKVEASMKGSYTCEADNGIGKPLMKTITVAVRGKLGQVFYNKKLDFAKQAHVKLHMKYLCAIDV